MAVTVKGMSGENIELASKGTSNAALGLGIAGTALGVLNSGGLLSGLMGNNPVNGVVNGTIGTDASCVVSKDLFYNTIIQQLNETAANNLSTERRLSGIEAAVSQNAAVAQCNKDAIRREIEITQILGDKNLQLATCNMVRGQTMISPTQIGDSFVAPSRIIDSYVPREYAPARGFYGGQCGMAYGGYAPGWDGCGPCDGFRGF